MPRMADLKIGHYNKLQADVSLAQWGRLVVARVRAFPYRCAASYRAARDFAGDVRTPGRSPGKWPGRPAGICHRTKSCGDGPRPFPRILCRRGSGTGIDRNQKIGFVISAFGLAAGFDFPIGGGVSARRVGRCRRALGTRWESRRHRNWRGDRDPAWRRPGRVRSRAPVCVDFSRCPWLRSVPERNEA